MIVEFKNNGSIELENDTLTRIKNYIFGAGGMALSLADLTGILQFIAALAGAILVCRQLWHDIYKKGNSHDIKDT